MSNRLQKMLKTWRKTTKPNDDKSLAYVSSWVEHLSRELKRHRGDEEFVTDLLDAAAIYFSDSFSDKEKTDAFIYALGLLSRKR